MSQRKRKEISGTCEFDDLINNADKLMKDGITLKNIGWRDLQDKLGQ